MVSKFEARALNIEAQLSRVQDPCYVRSGLIFLLVLSAGCKGRKYKVSVMTYCQLQMPTNSWAQTRRQD